MCCFDLTPIADRFHHNRKHSIFDTEIYTLHKKRCRKVNDLSVRKQWKDFFEFLKTIWVLH